MILIAHFDGLVIAHFDGLVIAHFDGLVCNRRNRERRGFYDCEMKKQLWRT